MKALRLWCKKIQYPYWYATAILGVLNQAYGEYKRGLYNGKKYKLVDNEDDIGYHWEEQSDE